jgi:hypothetical protein
MKDLNQLLKEYVVRAISDDYEEFERVLADVTGWAVERGIAVDRQRILKALEDAISEGYAQAYVLSTKPPYSTPVEYSPEHVDDLWFYVTPKGKQLALQLQEEWR